MMPKRLNASSQLIHHHSVSPSQSRFVRTNGKYKIYNKVTANKGLTYNLIIESGTFNKLLATRD